MEKEVPIKLWKWFESALTEIRALRPLINNAARCLYNNFASPIRISSFSDAGNTAWCQYAQQLTAIARLYALMFTLFRASLFSMFLSSSSTVHQQQHRTPIHDCDCAEHTYHTNLKSSEIRTSLISYAGRNPCYDLCHPVPGKLFENILKLFTWAFPTSRPNLRQTD